MVERLVVWHRAVAERRGGSDAAAIAAWSKAVAARFSAAGGSVLAQISGTVVGTFEPGDVADVIDLTLDLLDEADDAPFSVAFGAAVSELVEHGGVLAGAALDAAETLAVRAHPGEVVLDPTARERARGLFLFGRQIGAGSAANKAAAVDRTYPRRDACALAMSKLGPIPLAPATQGLLAALESALETPASLTVIRGPVGAGTIELLRAAEAKLAPAHVIELTGASAGIAPLASLRSAIVREPGLRSLAAVAPDDARHTLHDVVRGEIPRQEELLAALVRAVDATTGSVWLFLTPLAFVDGATLALVMALQRARPKVSVVMRHAVDAPLPVVVGDPPRVELTLPSLRMDGAREIAQAVLGAATPADVASRVAVLGGDTPLGVVEAARAMIGSGDLVHQDDRFVWRSTPRGGVRALALDALVAERLEHLDDESRRILEAVAVLPDGSSRSLVDSIARNDGVRARSIARALERLSREGWLDPRHVEDTPRPISSFVRRFVVSAAPPARAAELHRFAAAALEAGALASGRESVAMAAERAIQLLEGGRDDEAGLVLLGVATAVREAGHAASAAQLALAVVRSAAAAETRMAAQSLARDVSAAARAEGEQMTGRPPRDTEPTLRDRALTRAEPASAPVDAAHASDFDGGAPALAVDANGDPGTEERPIDDDADEGSDVVADVRDAIRRRDFEALERLAERAIAEGSDMAAVARLRALSEALRGDLQGAQRRLDRARAQNTPRDRRALLAEAMVALRAGMLPGAVRLSLSALADARRAKDERGEAVALFTMAACFRALGRHNDAALLESRVDA